MDTFKLSQDLSELVKSKLSDSLFDILVTLQSQKVEISPVDQSTLVLAVGVQLSEILCAGFLSGGIECDMVAIMSELLTSEQMQKVKFAKSISQLLVNYQEWLNQGAPLTDINMCRHHGFALLWIIENFASHLDKNLTFKAITFARSLLEKYPGRVADWGVGLAFYYQSSTVLFPALDPTIKRQDLLLGLVAQVQEKSFTLLMKAFEDNQDEELRALYMQKTYYFISCCYSQQNLCNEAQEWFVKAKLNNELPSQEEIIANENMKCLTKLFDFSIMYSENFNHSKERLSFLVAKRKYEFFHVPVEKLEIVENPLTESAMLRDILSKSTLELLMNEERRGNGFSLKDFFAPIKAITTSEAERRLKERMDQYQLESKRFIPGDGNCQFTSLSDQLTNEIAHAPFIRRTVVSWLVLNTNTILENGAKINEFSYDKPWEAYLQEMRKNGIWGDHLTLIAASEIFNKSIVVISSIPCDNNNYLLEIMPNIQNKDIPPTGKIMLSHLTEFHYGSMQEKQLDYY
jgi:hypothetical protein